MVFVVLILLSPITAIYDSPLPSPDVHHVHGMGKPVVWLELWGQFQLYLAAVGHCHTAALASLPSLCRSTNTRGAGRPRSSALIRRCSRTACCRCAWEEALGTPRAPPTYPGIGITYDLKKRNPLSLCFGIGSVSCHLFISGAQTRQVPWH